MRLGKASIEPPDRKWSKDHAQELFWSSIAKCVPRALERLRSGPFEIYHYMFLEFTFNRVRSFWDWPYVQDYGGAAFGKCDDGYWELEDVNWGNISRQYIRLDVMPILGVFNEFIYKAFGASGSCGFAEARVARGPDNPEDRYILCTDEKPNDSHSYIDANLERDLKHLVPYLQLLRNAVRDWVEEFWLKDDWCISNVLCFLYYWAQFPQCKDLPYMGSSRESERSYNNPTFYEPKEIENRLKATISKQIESGFVETPEKHDLRHFEWLVYRQVERLSCAEIARKSNLHEDSSRSVQKATNELADFIGLTLRYSGRGRRPATKTIGLYTFLSEKVKENDLHLSNSSIDSK
jgi:hypothetical protein